jgi:hypothetical protein
MRRSNLQTGKAAAAHGMLCTPANFHRVFVAATNATPASQIASHNKSTATFVSALASVVHGASDVRERTADHYMTPDE